SLGEYVAACVAGLMSLEDALGLVLTRAQLMQHLPSGGAMAAVMAPTDEVAKLVAPYSQTLAIAAVNAADNVVISGRLPDLEAVLGVCAERGIKTQRLVVSHAFHSPLMEPALSGIAQAASAVRFEKPEIG